MILDGESSNKMLKDPVNPSDDSQNDGKEQVAEEQESYAPKSNSSYGAKDYWEERYSKEKDYKWLLSYAQLASQLAPFLQRPNARILMLGSGNSPFLADMYDAGYHNIVNIDYSETVISAMKERHCTERSGMEWRVMDMTDMSELADESFDVVIDKATVSLLVESLWRLL
jgi:SAM-dependent methyltransferase